MKVIREFVENDTEAIAGAKLGPHVLDAGMENHDLIRNPPGPPMAVTHLFAL